MEQVYEEIGICFDSKESMIAQLNQKGYALIEGQFPYGKWLYSRIKDIRYNGIQPNITKMWVGCGTETNEVGEKFIDFRATVAEEIDDAIAKQEQKFLQIFRAEQALEQDEIHDAVLAGFEANAEIAEC